MANLESRKRAQKTLPAGSLLDFCVAGQRRWTLIDLIRKWLAALHAELGLCRRFVATILTEHDDKPSRLFDAIENPLWRVTIAGRLADSPRAHKHTGLTGVKSQRDSSTLLADRQCFVQVTVYLDKTPSAAARERGPVLGRPRASELVPQECARRRTSAIGSTRSSLSRSTTTAPGPAGQPYGIACVCSPSIGPRTGHDWHAIKIEAGQTGAKWMAPTMRPSK